MKKQVTITKNVVLRKTDFVEIPDDCSEDQAMNKAIDKIYHNGNTWEQIKVKSISIETD